MLSRSEWKKTPYAGTTAKDTFGNIKKLLEKYQCEDWTFAQGKGQNKRPAVMLRFKLHDKAFRIVIETLDVDEAIEALTRQAERCIFHLLKSSLEMSEVFMSVEKALFHFMELGDGGTIFEMPDEKMNELATAPKGFRLALPPKK